VGKTEAGKQGSKGGIGSKGDKETAKNVGMLRKLECDTKLALEDRKAATLNGKKSEFRNGKNTPTPPVFS
jgi:hypothetical protein